LGIEATSAEVHVQDIGDPAHFGGDDGEKIRACRDPGILRQIELLGKLKLMMDGQTRRLRPVLRL
jgi:hypothetical protein